MRITAAIHPACFRACFRVEAPISDWPGVFVIITAHATTGETWPVEKNEVADRALEVDTAIGALRQRFPIGALLAGCVRSDSCDRKTGVTKWCR